MSPSLLQHSEDPSGLHNIFSTSITPFDVDGILLLEDGDGLSIDGKLPILILDCAFELAISRIILDHVDHVVEVNEGVTDNIHFVRVKRAQIIRPQYGQIGSLQPLPLYLRVVAGTPQEDTAGEAQSLGK